MRWNACQPWLARYSIGSSPALCWSAGSVFSITKNWDEFWRKSGSYNYGNGCFWGHSPGFTFFWSGKTNLQSMPTLFFSVATASTTSCAGVTTLPSVRYHHSWTVRQALLFFLSVVTKMVLRHLWHQARRWRMHHQLMPLLKRLKWTVVDRKSNMNNMKRTTIKVTSQNLSFSVYSLTL